MLGKIEACSFRTFVATDIVDILILNIGDNSPYLYVLSFLEEGHRGEQDEDGDGNDQTNWEARALRLGIIWVTQTNDTNFAHRPSPKIAVPCACDSDGVWIVARRQTCRILGWWI